MKIRTDDLYTLSHVACSAALELDNLTLNRAHGFEATAAVADFLRRTRVRDDISTAVVLFRVLKGRGEECATVALLQAAVDRIAGEMERAGGMTHDEAAVKRGLCIALSEESSAHWHHHHPDGFRRRLCA